MKPGDRVKVWDQVLAREGFVGVGTLVSRVFSASEDVAQNNHLELWTLIVNGHQQKRWVNQQGDAT